MSAGLYRYCISGQVLRVKESEQEFREKEGKLKAATEQEAKEAVDQIKKKLTAARDLMEERKNESQKA